MIIMKTQHQEYDCCIDMFYILQQVPLRLQQTTKKKNRLVLQFKQVTFTIDINSIKFCLYCNLLENN